MQIVKWLWQMVMSPDNSNYYQIFKKILSSLKNSNFRGFFFRLVKGLKEAVEKVRPPN